MFVLVSYRDERDDLLNRNPPLASSPAPLQPPTFGALRRRQGQASAKGNRGRCRRSPALPLAGRYAQWLGASGRRYLFSVYDPSSCPAYSDAILVLAKVDGHGRRTILAIEDTGDFADPAVSRAMRTAARCDGAVEVHLHLLASTRPARREAIADLLCYATPSRN